MTQKPTLLFPLLLVIYEIASYLSNDMYLPALPQMMSDLKLTAKFAQLTLTAWFIGQAAMPLIIGVMSDRYGRRPVLLIGGVIYILATILCAVSHHPSILLIGRVVEGGMVASMLVAGYACVHELYDQKEAIRILALMGSISVLAPAFGPLLGGFVLYFVSWRGIFWIIALWALIAILLLSKWMPETLPFEKRRPVHIIKLLQHYGFILTNPRFMSLMLVLGLIFGGWIVWISAGPLLVIEDFHYSAMAFGVIQAIVFAAYILGNRLVKNLLEVLGVQKLIQLGLAMALCGGLLSCGLAIYFPNTLYPFLGAFLIYSLGSGLCFAPLNRFIIEASHEPMGIRVAFFSVFLSGFAALGSAMAGLFYDGSIQSLAYLIAAAIVLSCLIKIRTPK